MGLSDFGGGNELGGGTGIDFGFGSGPALGDLLVGQDFLDERRQEFEDKKFFSDLFKDPDLLASLIGTGLQLFFDTNTQRRTSQNINQRISDVSALLSPGIVGAKAKAFQDLIRSLILPGANVAGAQAEGDLAARLGRTGTSFTGQGEILRALGRSAPRIAAETAAGQGALDASLKTSLGTASAFSQIPIPQGTSVDLSGVFDVLQASELARARGG